MQANEGEGNRDCVIFRPNWRPSPPPDSSCFDGGARMPLVIPRVGTTPTREADGPRTDATDAKVIKTHENRSYPPPVLESSFTRRSLQ